MYPHLKKHVLIIQVHVTQRQQLRESPMPPITPAELVQHFDFVHGLAEVSSLVLCQLLGVGRIYEPVEDLPTCNVVIYRQLYIALQYV